MYNGVLQNFFEDYMAKKIRAEHGNVYVQKKPFYKRIWF
ncbi:immunity protein, partial [Streptococcus suis]